MKSKTRLISGWGKYPVIQSEVYRPESLDELKSVISDAKKVLAFGNNMSYGDSSLVETTVDMKRLNRILSFDQRSGVIKVESGILLKDLLEVVMPKGWFLMVTPGTKLVTVGGCVASNVHGKNHHEFGGFSNCVNSMEIVLASGKLIRCSRKENSDLFYATFGGMGLTGAIYSVEMNLKKIKSGNILVKYKKCKDVDEIFNQLDRLDKNHEYTVAWIDCFSKGKGVVMAGNHSSGTGAIKSANKSFLKVPFHLPGFFLNKLTIKLFNLMYYAHSPNEEKIVDIDAFFYPLDSVVDWNKVYGKKGFTQYQFVLPISSSLSGIKEILEEINNYGKGSFLAILKKFRDDDPKLDLSFPKEGYTLAMDFPMCKKTAELIKKLDEIVIRNCGRLYLTKDVLMTESMFKKTYHNINKWKKVKAKYDPNGKFDSLQARRVGLI